MELAHEKQNWEEFAGQDPFWAVLSDHDRKYGGWDRDDFYRTGEEQVAEILARAEELGHPRERGAALDFGSGLGRLTRALAARFESAVGVDISETMVANATKLNEDVDNVRFVLNTEPDLRQFDDASFDLVNTRIVLQHQKDRATIEGYIAEMLRILRPGGLLVFQLPARIPFVFRLQPRRNLYLTLRRLGLPPKVLYWKLGLHPNRMVAVPQREVIAFLEGRGARVLDSVVQRDVEMDEYDEGVYFVTKD